MLGLSYMYSMIRYNTVNMDVFLLLFDTVGMCRMIVFSHHHIMVHSSPTPARFNFRSVQFSSLYGPIRSYTSSLSSRCLAVCLSASIALCSDQALVARITTIRRSGVEYGIQSTRTSWIRRLLALGASQSERGQHRYSVTTILSSPNVRFDSDTQ